jgi:hypothetical protein
MALARFDDADMAPTPARHKRTQHASCKHMRHFKVAEVLLDKKACSARQSGGRSSQLRRATCREQVCQGSGARPQIAPRGVSAWWAALQSGRRILRRHHHARAARVPCPPRQLQVRLILCACVCLSVSPKS